MSKNRIALVLVSILAGTVVTWSLLAQSPATEAETLGVDTDHEFERLQSLPAAERRAELQRMSPDARRGLWFRLKRAEAEQRMIERGETPRPGERTQPVARAHAPTQAGNLVPRAPGSIQYDDGGITTSFNMTNAILGNRFDTHTSGINVMDPGTVDTVVAVVVQGSAFTTSSAGFVLLGPQTGGGGAMALFSSFTGGGGALTATVTFNGLGVTYTGSSFFVLFGAFNNSYVPAFGPGSTNGQGHHGAIGFTGGMGPNITTVSDQATLNALVRVTGNVLPVELTSFQGK